MNSEPTLEQAIILCGGLGTRLRPLTDSLPKPMVPVNGKPFLYHLLTQLADQGVKRFVLLTGYMGEKISDYFGDGAQYGWAISYSRGPVAWDTGRRLWEARELCDRKFLLLYSDNFVQFRLKQLKRLHSQLRTRITLLLAPKAKGNIKVSEDGRIQAYDKHRIGVGFDYVETGYMAVERDSFFADFPSYEGFPDFSLSALLQKYAQQQLLGGLIVRDPYHSISDPDRLHLM
jgi:NDP-sugar pyrophosphorylase family protein